MTTSENTMTNNKQSVQAEEIDSADGNGSQELTEQEIDEFISREQMSASEGNNTDINSLYTPLLGMEFKTKDDAQHFFNFYAYLAGFEIAVAYVFKTASKKRNNEVTKVTIKCNKYGKQEQPKTVDQQEVVVDKDIGKKKGPKSQTNVVMKIDCQCVMVVKEDNGVWRIIRLDLDHNHELQPGHRD